MRFRIGFVFLFLLFFIFLAGCATTPKLTTESFYVPARDPGIELYVRNKRPEGVAKFEPEKIVLFVSGATYPAESAFDVPLDGMSWMDYIAQRGYDVYLMDVRGYGASTRPPEMSRPPSENPPIVHTDVAVKDVGAVVDHILARRSAPKINLIGWSWGTAIMGGYTAQNSNKVERLVLVAPKWATDYSLSCQRAGGVSRGRYGFRQEAMVDGSTPGETKRLNPSGLV